MKSIRRYLVIILLAAITLINFVAAVQGYRAGMYQAGHSFDRQLDGIANIIASAVNTGDRRGQAPASPELVYQVWSSGQALLEHSDDAPAAPIARFEPGFDHANFDGYRWRTFSLYEAALDRWIFVAQRTDSRYGMADTIIYESILPIAIGIPVAGLIIWLVVGSGLSPLNRLARKLQQKQAEDLAPVQLASPPEELAPVLHSTNQLLLRISDLVTREKQFASDAAHELRTPISILKVHLHNLLHEHPEISGQARVFGDSLDRLEHLVDQMLAMYKSAPDQYTAGFDVLDLYATAQEVIAQRYDMIERRRQSIELLGEPARITASRFAIETLLQNLLDNASKYSGEGSDIRIEVDARDGHPRIRVEDSGPGIAEEDRAKVFERFCRIPDSSGGHEVTGSGLGLAIVKNIVAQHRATIELGDSRFASGLAVTITFPGAEER